MEVARGRFVKMCDIQIQRAGIVPSESMVVSSTGIIESFNDAPDARAPTPIGVLDSGLSYHAVNQKSHELSSHGGFGKTVEIDSSTVKVHLGQVTRSSGLTFVQQTGGRTAIQEMISVRNTMILRRQFKESGGKICHPALYEGCSPLLLTKEEVDRRISARFAEQEKLWAIQLKERNTALYRSVTSHSPIVDVVTTKALSGKYGNPEPGFSKPVGWSFCDIAGPANSPKSGNFYNGPLRGKRGGSAPIVRTNPRKINFSGVMVDVPLIKPYHGLPEDTHSLPKPNRNRVPRVASYKLPSENVLTKKQRSNAVRDSRLISTALRHGLTFAEPQAGFILSTDDTCAGQAGLFGVDLNHKLDPSVTGYLDEISVRIRDACQSVSDGAGEAVSTARELLENTTRQVSDGTSAIYDKVFDALGQFAKRLWLIPVLASLYYAIKTMVHMASNAMVQIVITLLGSIIPKFLWDRIKQYFTFSDRVVPQAGFFDANVLGNIISMAMSFVVFGDREPRNFLKNFHRNMSSHCRQVEGWSALTAFIGRYIEDLVNYVRKCFGKDSMTMFKSGMVEVDNWCTNVTEIIHASKNTDAMDPDTVHFIMALRREGATLMNTYRNDKTVKDNLHRYMGYLDQLVNSCSAAFNTMKGTRPPPVCMFLYGRPGIGKTLLTKHLSSMVMANHYTKEQLVRMGGTFDSQMYQLGSSEYWNGYTGQYTIICDDFGQPVAVPGAENEYMNLIRMVNCWAYPLNYADLENKGKNFFRSSFVLATTNCPGFDNACTVITETSALTRRVDFGYEVDVVPEYLKNGYLDMEKVEEYEREFGVYPYHAWVFYKHYFGIGEQSRTVRDTPYTLFQIIEQVQVRIQVNRKHHGVGNDALQTYLANHYNDKVEPQSGVHEKYEGRSWANEPFHDCVDKEPDFDDRLRDSFGHMVEGFQIQRNALEEERAAKIQKELDDMNRMNAEIKEYFEKQREWLQSYIDHPIVKLICYGAVAALITTILAQAVRLVCKWFFGQKKESLKSVLKKQSHIDDEHLAQVLSSFQASDFECVEEKDGKFSLKKAFGIHTLQKALARLSGACTGQSNEPPLGKIAHRVLHSRSVYESDKVIAQSDVQGNSIANAAAKNMMRVKIVGTKGSLILGHILFVAGRIGVIPSHYYTTITQQLNTGNLDDTDIMRFDHPSSKGFFIEMTIKDFFLLDKVSNKDDDATFVKFPSIRAQRNIITHFIRESDLTSLSKIRIRLDTIEGEDPFICRSRSLQAVRRDQLEVTDVGGVYTIADSFEYVGYTRNGDCGGVVCLEEASVFQCKRIVGIHVAGKPSLGLGFSNIITQEKIQKAMKVLGEPGDIEPQGAKNFIEVDPPIVDGSFTGGYKGPKPHNLNGRSSLLKTKLYGKWGDQGKKPARLSPFVNKDGVLVDPMVEALKSYVGPMLHYDQSLVNAAAHQAFKPLFDCTHDYDRGLYTFETAVAGVPGKVRGIPRNTSPGYPYILQGHTNKAKFFGSVGDYDFSSKDCKELREEVNDIIRSADNNLRKHHVYVDFLKDETRSLERVEQGKTRLISAAPLAYSIAFRIYFLAFTVAVQDTRVRNGVAVGINPYVEWDYLAKFMKSKGPHCIAGDYSSFDGSEQPQVHDAILEQINSWYDDGERNARIRRVLWLEVTNSRHYGGVNGKCDTLYQWNKSLPSGHPATSIINSFYNLTLFNMCWLKLAPKSSRNDFWEDVYVCTYGDDNIANVSPKAIAYFNQQTVTNAMRTFGMVYTSEDKTESVVSSRNLTEVSFLKRSFRYDTSLSKIIAPQELKSILYIPYWCKNRKDMEAITRTNVELTFAELSLHDPLIWDTYAPIIHEHYKVELGGRSLMHFDRLEYLNYTQIMEVPWL